MYVPRVIGTNQLKSYVPAKQEMLPGVEHRQHRYLTTVQRIRISRHASGSGGCRGSSHRVTLSAFSPPMALLRNTSAHDVTSSPPSNTVKKWGKIPAVGGDHRHGGGRLRAASVQGWFALVPLWPPDGITPNKLTRAG
jgi:hypothetical protein